MVTHVDDETQVRGDNRPYDNEDLTRIKGVGAKRAEALRAAGYHTISSVANCSETVLVGFSEAASKSIKAGAREIYGAGTQAVEAVNIMETKNVKQPFDLDDAFDKIGKAIASFDKEAVTKLSDIGQRAVDNVVDSVRMAWRRPDVVRMRQAISGTLSNITRNGTASP